MRKKTKPQEQKLPTVLTDEISESPEELELNEFMDNLGPEGVSEVRLYRVLPNHKRSFVTSGPPAQFTELSVQTNYGPGDYMVRAMLNGDWLRSKSFTVEAAPGTVPIAGTAGSSSELDRIKGELEAERIRLQQQQLKMETDRREQEARMEADRREREQRNHELQLEMFRSFANHGNNANNNSMNIADIIGAVRSLKDMGSGQDEIYKSIDRALGLAGRLKDLRGEGNANGESGNWWEPVLTEAGKQLLPKFLPFLNNGVPPPGMPMPPMQPPIAPVSPGAPAPTVATPETPQSGQPPQQPGASITPTEEQQQAAFLEQKRGALAFALTMARLNRPAEVYADMAIERVETANDEVSARFIQEIAKAESFGIWFADLEKLDPTIITQRPWFELFFNTVRDAVSAKLEEESQG